MNDEQTPAPEAGDEVVHGGQETSKPEAAQNTTGQIDDQPADATGGDPEAEDKPSASKIRRERRKQEMERAKDSEAKAIARAEAAERALADLQAASRDAPKESDFEDHAEYQAALSAHKAVEALDERERARLSKEAEAGRNDQKAAQDARNREVRENFAAQVEDARTRYADFDQVAFSARISDGLAQQLAESDHGADIAYHLGKNGDEAARLSAMSPLEQARALGRLEATLTAPTARTETTAPQPISPVKAKGTVTKDPSKMSPQEWRKFREGGGTI
ncbi:MAG: hypothetical protein MRY81_10140 [Donghicola eburneus]|jgi:hypothetical protein|nr:hypothetical protein [Donghicola eburneus]MCI5040032.1 hypothetical protein [Donghicola eburneus]